MVAGLLRMADIGKFHFLITFATFADLRIAKKPKREDLQWKVSQKGQLGNDAVLYSLPSPPANKKRERRRYEPTSSTGIVDGRGEHREASSDGQQFDDNRTALAPPRLPAVVQQNQTISTQEVKVDGKSRHKARRQRIESQFELLAYSRVHEFTLHTEA